MLHLVDKTYIDYDFTGSIGRESIIYIGESAKWSYEEGVRPLGQFTSVSGIMETFGGFDIFLECLNPQKKKVFILLDEESLNELLVAWLLSLFPRIDHDNLHRVVKLNAVNHKYEHGSRTNSRGNKKVGLMNLKIPTKAETRHWMAKYQDIGEVSHQTKTRASFEYLLAHSLAVDFAPDDEIVSSLTSRMETILWKSIAWDFVGIRRDMLYGIYNLKDNFGIELDIEREDIDEQVAALSGSVVFSPDNHPGNVEFIKQHYQQLREFAGIVGRKNGNTDTTFDYLMEILPEGPLTIDQARRIVEHDKSMHCSQIFGRTEFRDNMNNNLISYLYRTHRDALHPFVL